MSFASVEFTKVERTLAVVVDADSLQEAVLEGAFVSMVIPRFEFPKESWLIFDPIALVSFKSLDEITCCIEAFCIVVSVG